MVTVTQNYTSTQYQENSFKGKGKIHPKTGHEGPEEEQRYSSNLSLTSAQYGRGWSMACPCLKKKKKNPLPIV
jgi:hypothetical protein